MTAPTAQPGARRRRVDLGGGASFALKLWEMRHKTVDNLRTDDLKSAV